MTTARKAPAKSAKGPTPKKDSARHRTTGGSRVVERAKITRRYTAPIPKAVKRSPKWLPWVVLGLLLVGMAVIIINYLGTLPGSPTNWYLLVGLALLFTGFLFLTRWR